MGKSKKASAMNTAIATRLLWKEYRQQRNLWIALLFGATLLQLIFWYFIEAPRTEKEMLGLLPLYVGTAAMMTALFAVCSTAISFAIEREEGTHLRLVSLSCPPGLTLSIKLLVGLLGTVLLFAVSGVIGASLSVGVRAAIEAFKATSTAEAAAACYWVIAVVGGGLVVGAFCSLVFRKVLPAVIAATVTMFVGWPVVFSVWVSEIQMGSDGWWNRSAAIGVMVVLVGGIGVFGLIDFVLVRWWMNRSFSEMPKVRSRSLFRRVRIQRDGLDGSVTLEIGGGDRAELEVLTPEQARIVPPPRLGLSLLYNNWGRGRSRVLCFLCWKESAESRRFFQYLLGSSILVAVFAGYSMHATVEFDPHLRVKPSNAAPFLVITAVVSIFVCGLMSFRGEQSGDSYRLLSDRGVSPGYVWASKQIVWLTRLFLMVLIVVAIVVAVAGGRFYYLLWLISDPTTPLGDVDLAPPVFSLLTSGLVYFSICQMASLTWRRAALSIFSALLCCSLMAMWQSTASHFDVPVFVAALPLAPALLLMTRLRTRSWLTGDDRFKRWLLPGLMGVLGIVACWLTTATWRIYEVPSAEPLVATKTLDDGSTIMTINGLTEEERAAILAPVSDEEAATAKIYQQFGAVGTDTLATCREAAVRPLCAFESPGSEVQAFGSFTRNHMKDYSDRLLRQARLEAGAGNLAEALELHREAFVIARHAAGRGANGDYNRWNVITHSILESLVAWSQSGGATLELVNSAISVVDEHFAKSLDPYAVSFAEHSVIRNTLRLPVEQRLAERGNGEFSNDQFFFASLSVRFPGTRARADRLVDWYEVRSARLIAEAQKIEARRTSGNWTLGNWYRQEAGKSRAVDGGLAVADFRRWLQTTPHARELIDDIGLSLVYSETDLKTQARGTQVAMRLWLAFHENEEFPRTLDELNLPAEVVIEPWSGQPFAWYPSGIPNEIVTTSPRIPANTPFLFSGGPSGVYLVRGEERVEGSIDPPPQVVPLMGGGAADELADKLGGAVNNSDLRWKTRTVFSLRESEPNAGQVHVQPTVWLFPRDSDDPDGDGEKTADH
jgi:hypothetical protein